MQQNIQCDHCGADSGRDPVIWNDKYFCCNGCKQVYQLLHEHHLHKYYEADAVPGIRLSDLGYDNKYAFLDREDVKEKMYDFHEDSIAKVIFYIPAIHCASCIWLLERLNKLNPGIKHGYVNFVKKELAVTFNTTEITLRQVVELLVSIHYIPDISLQTLNKKDITSTDKKLIYKIGVAGFVFGNVMLFSLPEYFNGEKIEGNLGVFFNYLSFALTVPLVFFSGSDYILSAWKNIRKRIVNIDLPIALGLITLFIVTAYEVFGGYGAGYSDSLSGFLFFLLIGKWYQSKTYQSLSFDRDYQSYFPVAVTKIHNDKEVSILLEDVKVDDILLIRTKELIPADSELLTGDALIDYSFVTGESNPVYKNKGELLYAGGIQTTGSIMIKVSKEVKQSHLTQLWNQSEKRTETTKSLKSLIDKISVYFTITIILIAFSGFTGWMLTGHTKEAFLVFTAILIVACPCALALSIPFTFGNAMRILGNKGLYLKNTAVIEKLTRLNTVVFDKTGTITLPDENNIEFIGENLSKKEKQVVASMVRQSMHPLSVALAKFYADLKSVNTTGFVEMPGRGIFSRVDSQEVMLGSREFVGAEVSKTTDLNTCVYLKIDNKLKGYFRFSNKYRPSFEQVISRFKNNKYDLYLLSGDNEAEKSVLIKYFQEKKMYFNQQPEQKLDFVKRLQEKGRNVLMTGDGLNDAGAFMQSNVALSVADDIYHFSPAGDAIIEAKKFGSLFDFVQYAGKSLTIVKISFIISFLYNIIGLTFAITGNLSPVVAAILMPVSSVSVVMFTTFSTRILARKL